MESNDNRHHNQMDDYQWKERQINEAPRLFPVASDQRYSANMRDDRMDSADTRDAQPAGYYRGERTAVQPINVNMIPANESERHRQHSRNVHFDEQQLPLVQSELNPDAPEFHLNNTSTNVRSAADQNDASSNWEQLVESTRARTASDADSLLDQELDNSCMRLQQQQQQQPIRDTTPLLQPEPAPVFKQQMPVEEQQQVPSGHQAPDLDLEQDINMPNYYPPQMAEFDMDNRRNNAAADAFHYEQPRMQSTQPLRVRPILHGFRDLMLWRNPRDSAVIFSSGVVLMLSLSYFSLISVFAYISLTILTIVSMLVFGRQLMHILQKRGDAQMQTQPQPHMFQQWIQQDMVINPQYIHQQLDGLLYPLNQKLVGMRNLYLADSLAETLKYAFYMYLLTYVGAWFNLLTLMIMAWVCAFTLPKLYVMYRPQVDAISNYLRSSLRQFRMNLQAKFDAQRQRIRQSRDNRRQQTVEKKVTIKKVEKVQ